MNDATMKYIVDTCSFTALRRVYPEDVFPGVWKLMDALASNGIVKSVDDVFEELKAQDDGVYKWAQRNKGIFLPLSPDIQAKATTILSVYGENFIDLKRRKSGADPFIVAAAIISNCAVVTEEKPSGGPPKVKIPDVCRTHNTRCITVLDVLRAEGLRLG